MLDVHFTRLPLAGWRWRITDRPDRLVDPIQALAVQKKAKRETIVDGGRLAQPPVNRYHVGGKRPDSPGGAVLILDVPADEFKRLVKDGANWLHRTGQGRSDHRGRQIGFSPAAHGQYQYNTQRNSQWGTG